MFGDEGDLAVDARDWMYYVDTQAADVMLHVWSDHGNTWQYSKPVVSTFADDRPWVAAQKTGIVHYIGNNGQAQPGLREIYYRSTDGGVTFTPGYGLPGSGWAHVAAWPTGNYTYILQEATADEATDLTVISSPDAGATLPAPVKAAHRDGNTGDGFPLIAADAGDNPSFVWVDTKDGDAKGTHIFIAQSHDHGKTWNSSDITPFAGYIDHVVVAAAGGGGEQASSAGGGSVAGGAPGVTAVAFYATPDLPLSAQSKWYLYAGIASGPVAGPASFDFKQADPKVLYTGADKHALHDFFEIAITPDGALNIAYQQTLPQPASAPTATDGDRHLWFVRATT
ncbi:MAG: hypothetical protein ACYDCK_00240 [Thermoplasmatota archaeon]